MSPFWNGQGLVCVDLETTGGSALHSRIIEIGVVEIDADGTAREWSTLVNPGVRIPSAIVAFTGITDDMVAAAPRFEEIYRELLARLTGRIFVAHNARFDYGFIRAELARIDIRFKAKVLCTVKLSRRLFPSFPRHHLDALIERHGLTCDARHRALGDARVLRALLDAWRQEIDAAVLTRAVTELLQEASLPSHLPADLSDDLPESPGIYRFFGEADALLYVGKSSNLRKRVLEHFASTHRSDAEHRLAVLVRRVTWQETAGEIGALLIESQAVKREKPLYNRQLRQVGQHFTIRITGAPHEALSASIVEVDSSHDLDGIENYGLYRDERSALRALQAVARAHQLCARVLGLESSAATGSRACFAYQLKRCKGACVGEESPVLHGIRVRMALSSIKLPSWPYQGRILLVESDWRGQQDFHVLDQWRYLGTVQDSTDAVSLEGKSVLFDVDIFRLLRRVLSTLKKGVRIIEVARA